MTKDYAVISFHENDFWQICVYWKIDHPPVEGDVPDHFKTCRVGSPVDVAKEWVARWYPNAELLIKEGGS